MREQIVMWSRYYYGHKEHVEYIIAAIKKSICADAAGKLLYTESEGFLKYTLLPLKSITKMSQLTDRRPVNSPVPGRNY